MKILVLTNFYPPHALGGYEMSCRDVLDRWTERGHQTHVLTTTYQAAGVPDVEQPHVERTLSWYWSDHEFVRPAPGRRLALERRNHALLATALDTFRPDVVSVWGMGGMSLSLLTTCYQRSVPVVLNVCDEWPVYGPKVDAWLSAWSRRAPAVRRLGAALSRVPTELPRSPDKTAALYVSRFAREKAEGAGFRLPSAVVGSGIDTDDFPPAPLREQPWRWRLLAVGRVEPRKGFDIAIRALADLPELATLRIVGRADERHVEALRGLAAELRVADRVTFEALPRDQLAQCYREADVTLFPARWHEPFGLVPIESMSQRTPVVATHRGGSAEFLRPEVNCLGVPVEDPAAVAQSVMRLASDPGLRTRLTEAGIATAASYTVDRLALTCERWHNAVDEGRLDEFDAEAAP